MASDWTLPINTTNYASVLGAINGKALSTAKMDYTGDTNLFSGTVRLNQTTGGFEQWNGSAWVVVDLHKLSNYTLSTSGDGVVTYTSVTTDRAVYKLGGGGMCWVSISCVGTTGGTSSASLGVGLPITAVGDNQPFTCCVQDASGWLPAAAVIPGTNLGAVTVTKGNGANFGLGAGRRITMSGWYKVA